MNHKRGKPKGSRAGCCCNAKLLKQPGCKAKLAMGGRKGHVAKVGLKELADECNSTLIGFESSREMSSAPWDKQ